MSQVPRSPVTLIVTGIMALAVAILAVAAASFAFLYRMDSAVEEVKRQTDEVLEGNQKLTELVEAQRRADASRQERLDEAVALVDDALQKRLSEHDADMVFLDQVLLYQIAQLISRPAGVPVDPVTARGLGGGTTTISGGTRSIPTAPTSSTRQTATTTTTTTPSQKTCDRRDGPRC